MLVRFRKTMLALAPVFLALLLGFAATGAARADLIVRPVGTAGAGTSTWHISGSATAADTITSVFIFNQVSVPDFLDVSVPETFSTSATGGCSINGGATTAFAQTGLRIEGLAGTDNLRIALEAGLARTVGDTITCAGTITVPVDVNNITNVANVAIPLTADGFAGIINPANTPAPSAGATGSERLADQQEVLSAMVVNFQSNNLGDMVFDHLGNAFGQDAGPQVAANGFSASTQGVAAWLGETRQRKIESQLADLSDAPEARYLLATPAAASPKRQPAWNAWIKGKWTSYDGDGSSFDGHMIDVLAGVDYRVYEMAVVGVLGGYGNTDFDTEISGTSGSFKADGYSVGPYMAIRLSDNTQFDALAAYTYSDYENRSGATGGEFIAHRVTVAAQLKGMWTMENFFIEPGIRIVYAEEYQDAWTDSSSVRHASQTVTAGRLSIGPKFGLVFSSEDGGSVRPWVSLKGEYDFSNKGDVPTSGLPDFDDILSSRVSVGLDASTAEGLSISLQGEISGLGSDAYTGYGGSAQIGLPF